MNGNSGLGLAAGLMQGFAQGRQMKMSREQEKEAAAIKKQLLTLQLTNAKADAEERKVLADIIRSEYAKKGASEPTPQPKQPSNFGESFGQSAQAAASGGEMDLTGQMANQSLMDLSPIAKAAVKKLYGLDLMEAGRLKAQEGNLSLRQKEFDRGNTEWRTVDIPDGKGGFVRKMVPKYGAETGGSLGYNPPNLAVRTYTEGGKEYEQPINPTTREPAGPPVLKSEKKGLPKETTGALGMMEQGLSDIKSASAMLFDKNGNVTDNTYKILAEASVPGGGLPWSKGREFNSYVLNAMEGKIRIESGAAVPKEEIARLAQRFKPSVLDSKALIKSKMIRLQEYLEGQIEKLDPNKTYRSGTEIITGDDGQKYAWVPKVKEGKKLTEEMAMEFLKQAGGDKDKARQIAKEQGYTF